MQPSEDEILAALKHYRAACLEHNSILFPHFIRHAETEQLPEEERDQWTTAEVAEARQSFMYRMLSVSRPSNLDPSLRVEVPADVMTKWDAMVVAFGLDGVFVTPDTEHRRELCAAYKSGVEAGLRRIGADIDFPADFEFLMSQVDSLEGQGWPEYRGNDQQIRFWSGLGESETDVSDRVFGPDDDLGKETGLDDDNWEAAAAWECGRGPETRCFVAYCRHEENGKEWRWRYVAERGQYGVDVFDNLVELLQWYETLYKPDLTYYLNFSGVSIFQC
ncbi:hypothetical protein F5B19DRAFT_464591 [Rostrohypoxylon terebratum]|nr:hypothetical protein F5B19DRAFT_464591 [Rostrohypoxylon terebratum]